jgi:hypothetical protein
MALVLGLAASGRGTVRRSQISTKVVTKLWDVTVLMHAEYVPPYDVIILEIISSALHRLVATR